MDHRRGNAASGLAVLARLGAVLLATACSSEAEPGAADPDPGCEGRGEPIAVGMTRQSADDALGVALESAAPLPPQTGDNAWTVRVSSAGGDAVEGAVIVARAVMLDHAHPPSPPQLAIESAAGVYEIAPIVLTMPGFWRLTFGVTEPEQAEQEIPFGLCVER